MSIKEKIFASILLVVENSSFVSIDPQKLIELAKVLKGVGLPQWNNELQFLGSEEQTVQYYFLLDSLNFCFWPKAGEEKWAYQKDDQWLTGYYAFSYALKNAVERDPKFLNAQYLSSINFADFARIFTGKGELQLLPERQQIVNENFQILLNKYDGQAANLVASAGRDVNTLVESLLRDFPKFRDIVESDGQTVYFLKRAQIFPNDISVALHNQGLGEFTNLEDLAVFADYKLPQLLEARGVLVYSPALRNKIIEQELISPRSREELEIRANTVYACNLLTEELNKLGRALSHRELDWLLWTQAKQTEFNLPHHKTVSIYY